MLKINANEEKQLTFEAQIGGAQKDQIKSFLRLMVNDVEYGFPAEVHNETIIVNLPKLNRIINTKVDESEEIEIKLEVIADGQYLVPWKDTIKLSNPLVVEAKIKDNTLPVITESHSSKYVENVSVKNEPNVNESMFGELLEKIDKLIDMKTVQPEKVKQKVEKPIEKTNLQNIKEAAKNEEESMKLIESLVKSKIGKKITKESKPVAQPTKKQMTIQEFKKTLTREDIMKFIEKKGSKNKKIQEIIYEQAVASAGTSEPIVILKKVMEIMRVTKKK